MTFPNPTQYQPDLFVEVFFAVIHDPASSDSPENYRTWPVDPALRIPKRHLWSFNLPNQNWTPYIAYVCYAILGTKGSLSTSRDSIVIPELDTLHSSRQNTQIYYHARERGFPIDLCVETNASVTHTSSRDDSFSADVLERDQCCPFTEHRLNSDATHIVKHSKGNEYMKSLLARAPDDMAVTEIDSPANGLILDVGIHRAAGRGDFAFIRTPVSDVLKSSDLHENADDDRVMLTAHYIKVDIYDPAFKDITVRPNQDVYLETLSDVPLPPCYLFDAVYASHCLHTWGNKVALKDLFDAWSHQYLQAGKESNEEDLAKKQRQKYEKRQKARAERRDNEIVESVARFQPLIDNVLGPDYGPIETEEEFWDMALLLLRLGPCPRQLPESYDTRPEIVDKVKEWQAGLS
ncbi:hypothetical protein K435DRAFT_855554 [Dendrothele bispora CBS 962.96]|uniref:HNH nuclease domain-containing protein n=1 Tax=Dendrothele bispora (strain CBS 962.96) TaxID=1314807 RepID=A0A4S8MAT0_DENBC|nr:hypothetical protein K435DRAFT_855554 [Dendrothele bispora CBS 962.96]